MIEMFIERAHYGAVRGEHWRASWFDRELGCFVGGAGPSAFSAIAWACVAREETKAGMIVIARNGDATPEATLAAIRGGSGSIPLTNTEPSAHPRFEITPTPTTEPKKRSAAARRSTTARKKKTP